MLFSSAFAVAMLAGAVAAQGNATTIDPNSVAAQTKAAWCNGQISACGTLCNGNAPTNLCNPTLLTYSCLCANGSSPDLKDYKTTLPDFICEQAFANCINANPNDLTAQTACKSDIQSQCGFLDLANYTASSSTSSSAASSSTSAPASSSSTTAATTTAASTSASASATKASAAMALSVGQDYGVGFVAAGVVAAFGFFL